MDKYGGLGRACEDVILNILREDYNKGLKNVYNDGLRYLVGDTQWL
jgi:hypothetical protein